jgi:hypothetical protein
MQNTEKQAGADICSFKSLQLMVCLIIQKWVTTPSACTHKFYQVWNENWKDILTASSPFSLVKKQLKINDLEAYCDIISQCPDVMDQLQLHYNKANSKIHYSSSGSTTKPIIAIAQTKAKPAPKNFYSTLQSDDETIQALEEPSPTLVTKTATIMNNSEEVETHAVQNVQETTSQLHQDIQMIKIFLNAENDESIKTIYTSHRVLFNATIIRGTVIFYNSCYCRCC